MAKRRVFHLNVERRLRISILSAVALVAASAGIFYYFLDKSGVQLQTLVDQDYNALEGMYQNKQDVDFAYGLYNKTRIGWREITQTEFLALLERREIQASFSQFDLVAKTDGWIDDIRTVNEVLNKVNNGERANDIAKLGPGKDESISLKDAVKSLVISLTAYGKTLDEFRNMTPKREVQTESVVGSKLDSLIQKRMQLETTLTTMKAEVDRLVREVPPDEAALAAARQDQLSVETNLNDVKNEIINVQSNGVSVFLTPEERAAAFDGFLESLQLHETEIDADISRLDQVTSYLQEKLKSRITGDRQELDLDVRDALDSMLIIAGIGIIIGLIIYVLAPRTVALPMKRLINLIEDIRDGHYTITSKLETDDDLGTLFRHLHGLARTEAELEGRRRDLITIKEKRFQLLADRLGPLIVLGSDRRLIYVNPAFLQLVDCEREDLVGQVIDSSAISDTLLNSQFVAAIGQSLERRERRDDYKIGEVRPESGNDDSEGVVRHVISTHFIRDLRGEVVEMIVTIRKETDESWQHLFELSPIAK